jgi:hypothetical protein
VVALSRIRAAIIVLLVVGLVVAGYTGYRLFTEEPDHDAPVSKATGTTDDGWQQVTYRGVTVEVPAEWERLDPDTCQGSSEHWGPADLDPCADDRGLWFLESATFDPATGPGVHAVPISDNLPAGGWGGYVTRGKVVVNVVDSDQAAARRILQSVSQVI